MRITHVLAPARVGGLEGVVVGLARGQRERGHDVSIVTVGSQSDTEPFRTWLSDSNISAAQVRLSNRGLLREQASVISACRAARSEVVHTHGYRPDVLHLAAARKIGAAGVATIHGFTAASWRVRVYERMELLALRRADAVIAVSRPLLRTVVSAGVSRDRVHFVMNAHVNICTPLSRAQSLSRLSLNPTQLNIGWIGRLGREKGPDIAVAAVSLLRDLPVTLSMIGDGAERAASLTAARSLGIEDMIRFHGIVPGSAALLSAFDVILISSRTEGTPLVLLEAMAAGTPVVTTRVGGIPDVVTDREAILVDRAEPSALASGLREVLTNRHAAEARADNARLRVNTEFSADLWLNKYEDVYSSAVRNSRR